MAEDAPWKCTKRTCLTQEHYQSNSDDCLPTAYFYITGERLDMSGDVAQALDKFRGTGKSVDFICRKSFAGDFVGVGELQVLADDEFYVRAEAAPSILVVKDKASDHAIACIGRMKVNPLAGHPVVEVSLRYYLCDRVKAAFVFPEVDRDGCRLRIESSMTLASSDGAPSAPSPSEHVDCAG